MILKRGKIIKNYRFGTSYPLGYELSSEWNVLDDDGNKILMSNGNPLSITIMGLENKSENKVQTELKKRLFEEMKNIDEDKNRSKATPKISALKEYKINIER